jgi:hypothetical protein
MILETTRTGYRDLDPECHSAGLDWATCPPHYTDDQVRQAFGIHEGRSYYLDPGQPYAREALIRRSNGRVLITQHCGMDI